MLRRLGAVNPWVAARHVHVDVTLVGFVKDPHGDGVA